jgi:hypothetical protein
MVAKPLSPIAGDAFSAVGQVISGEAVSVTVMVNEQVTSRDAVPSVAVYVTVVVVPVVYVAVNAVAEDAVQSTLSSQVAAA